LWTCQAIRTSREEQKIQDLHLAQCLILIGMNYILTDVVPLKLMIDNMLNVLLIEDSCPQPRHQDQGVPLLSHTQTISQEDMHLSRQTHNPETLAMEGWHKILHSDYHVARMRATDVSTQEQQLHQVILRPMTYQ
jgi:hypothetical protein